MPTWTTYITAADADSITVNAMPDPIYSMAATMVVQPVSVGGTGGGLTAQEIAAEILVTPANTLATAATGEASANVTLWKGAEPLGLSGNAVSVSVELWRASAVPAMIDNLIPATVQEIGKVQAMTLSNNGFTGNVVNLSAALTIDPAALVGALVTFDYEASEPAP